MNTVLSTPTAASKPQSFSAGNPRFHLVCLRHGWGICDMRTGKDAGFRSHSEDEAIEEAARLNRQAEAPQQPKTEPCFRCGSTIPANESDPNLCTGCEQLAIEQAIQEARGVVRDLRKGSGPFVKLPAGVRMRHLASLFGNSSAGPTRCEFSDLSNEDLIQLAGEAADEISRRMASVPAPAPKPVASFIFTADSYRPTDAERDDIESRIEAEEPERWDTMA